VKSEKLKVKSKFLQRRADSEQCGIQMNQKQQNKTILGEFRSNGFWAFI